MLVYSMVGYLLDKHMSMRFFSELFDVSPTEYFELVLYPSIALKVVFQLLVIATFSVVWHRLFLVQSERKKFRSLFSFGKRQQRFWAVAIVFGLVGASIAIPVTRMASGQAIWDGFQEFGQIFSDNQKFNTYFLPVLYSTTLYTLITGLVISRWILVLPSIAVDDFLSFRQSWQLSKGNGFRLWCALTLATLPLQIFISALGGWMIFEWHLRWPPIFNSSSYFLITAIGISALSISYSSIITRTEPAADT